MYCINFGYSSGTDLPEEYAHNAKIHTEPAFNWWVPHLLRKKSCLVSKIKARLHKSNRKFGIAIPRSYEEVVTFDQANNNKLWQNAWDKEMKNIKIAFNFLDDGIPPPPGYKQRSCFIIFDIMIDLTCKARFVAG